MEQKRQDDKKDLLHKSAVDAFLQTEKPDYLFIAAAKVGGFDEPVALEGLSGGLNAQMPQPIAGRAMHRRGRTPDASDRYGKFRCREEKQLPFLASNRTVGIGAWPQKGAKSAKKTTNNLHSLRGRFVFAPSAHFCGHHFRRCS